MPLNNGKFKVDIEFEISKHRSDTLKPLNLSDFIDVVIFGENKIELYLEKHKITNANNKISIVVNRRPIEVAIDPYHKLIETDSDNNRKEL